MLLVTKLTYYCIAVAHARDGILSSASLLCFCKLLWHLLLLSQVEALWHDCCTTFVPVSF